MLEKALKKLMDSLRSRPHTSQDNFVVAVALLVWGNLSVRDKLPNDESWVMSSTNFKKFCSEKLCEFDEGLFEKIPGETFDVVNGMTGILLKLPLHDVCTLDPRTGGISTPSEIADLMLELGELDASDKVYCPWDDSGQLSGRVASICKKSVFTEIQSSESIMKIVSLLFSQKPEIKIGDPVTDPSALAEDGTLRQFDASIAVPPFNKKYHRKDIADYHDRLPEKTSSSSVLTTSHLLSQTKRRVVVLQPLNILFSSGAEAAFRKMVVNKGMVEAVVNFPGGMFASTTIPFCILILNPRGGENFIRFVDVEMSDFISTADRKKVVLEDVSSLATAILDKGEDLAFARNISKAEIADNDYDLQVSKYIVSDEWRNVIELLSKSKTVTVVEACQVVKTMPPKAITDDGESNAWTFDMSSFTAHGYMKPALRAVKVDDSQISADQYLQANDILIVTKGSSVGRVGIVPLSAPPHGENGWLPTTLGTVLRCSENSAIDPRVLFIQLRSAFGQILLKAQAVGASIPVIRVSSFKSMELIIPEQKESGRMVAVFEKEVDLQVQIDKLKNEQAKQVKQLDLFN